MSSYRPAKADMGNETTIADRIRALQPSKGSSASQKTDNSPRAQQSPEVKAYTLCRESDVPDRVAGDGSHMHLEVAADEHLTVESLDDLLDTTILQQDSAREDTPSPMFDHSHPPHDSTSGLGPGANGKKRKAGNPVHPSILAAGQRIISSDSSNGSRASSCASTTDARVIVPVGGPSLRDRIRAVLPPREQSEGSQAPSTEGNTDAEDRPLTASSGSRSPRSLGLSDEEGSFSFDDLSGQLVSSASEDESEPIVALETGASKRGGVRGPQLVMPRLASPPRKSFTERGRRLGCMRIVVTGGSRVVRGRFINEILGRCEDIVCVEEPVKLDVKPAQEGSTQQERFLYRASTKACPTYKIKGGETRLKERKERLLEKNVLVFDIAAERPESADKQDGESGLEIFVKKLVREATGLDRMTDATMLSMLSGEGGCQIGLVIYILDHGKVATNVRVVDLKTDMLTEDLSSHAMDHIRRLTGITNVMPILIKPESDGYMPVKEESLSDVITSHDWTHVGSSSTCANTIRKVTLASFEAQNIANQNTDGRMTQLSRDIFDPETMQRLCYTAARKALRYSRSIRQDGRPLAPLVDIAPSEDIAEATEDDAMTCSFVSSPSGVLVPAADSSFYASALSPTLSACTIDSTSPDPSNRGLALLCTGRHAGPGTDEASSAPSPIGHVRLAPWALDLQRSLEAERARQRARWVGVGKVSSAVAVRREALCSSSTGSSSGDELVTRDASDNEAERSLGRRIRDIRRGQRHEARWSGGEEVYDPLGIIGLQDRLARGELGSSSTLLKYFGVGAVVGTCAVWMVRNWDRLGEGLRRLGSAVGLGHETRHVDRGGYLDDIHRWQDGVSWSNALDGILSDVQGLVKGLFAAPLLY